MCVGKFEYLCGLDCDWIFNNDRILLFLFKFLLFIICWFVGLPAVNYSPI